MDAGLKARALWAVEKEIDRVTRALKEKSDEFGRAYDAEDTEETHRLRPAVKELSDELDGLWEAAEALGKARGG